MMQPQSIIQSRRWMIAGLAFCVFIAVFLSSRPARRIREPVAAWVHHQWQEPSHDYSGDPTYGLMSYPKPEGFRIVALVFFGRREFTSILDCYLRRNLANNGGLLDEVIFVERTDIQEDLDWLENVLGEVPEYSKVQTSAKSGKYGDAWSVCEAGTLYIKIDDDVVFFEDHTIAALVQRMLSNPSYFLVSANVVNQPNAGWVHYHLNTMYPYLPELTPPGFYGEEFNWRPSLLPPWSGPDNYTIDKDDPAPHPGHRWLPLDPLTTDIIDTPIAAATYHVRSPIGKSWPMAAQIHYSFLQNLESRLLHRYKFDLWDYDYDRTSINFMAIWGDDIVANYDTIKNDLDEVVLTLRLPRKYGRHAVMDGRGLAVHFGFHQQADEHGEGGKGQGLLDTDLSRRYSAFSQERICQKPRGSSFYAEK